MSPVDNSTTPGTSVHETALWTGNDVHINRRQNVGRTPWARVCRKGLGRRLGAVGAQCAFALVREWAQCGAHVGAVCRVTTGRGGALYMGPTRPGPGSEIRGIEVLTVGILNSGRWQG